MGAQTAARLADWPLGEPALFVEARGDEVFRRRLGQLGVRAGSVLTPLHRTPGRGLVLAVGPSRVALDRASVDTIRVREPSAPPSVLTPGRRA